MAVLLKLAPGWALIQVNFDPIQQIRPKVGGGHSFVSGPFFARLRYSHSLCAVECMIAERLSAKLWIRDLFLGCAFVCTCVRTYVSVTLRNVDLKSQLDTCITWRRQDDICLWRRTGRTTQLACIFCGATSAERSQWLVTLRKTKQRSLPTVETKRVKAFKSRKHVLEILHKPGIWAHSSHYHCFILFFGLPLNEQCLTHAPHAPSTHDAWRGTGIIRMRSPSYF